MKTNRKRYLLTYRMPDDREDVIEVPAYSEEQALFLSGYGALVLHTEETVSKDIYPHGQNVRAAQ